ncbi:uncharacterized protein K460DRAFT_362494 [Cucurbitaria berberidis CBS 394.84]|uniref:Thioesterase domain-containing protein n=1 Tax=Cucurbitaria berberidis CBS 394.84 TaxID=1168544 RepID=A0A9P4GUF8_9PLEO|nr:uncharacterized protein K460DRAFT_362494 [Cucurbitaria berberidis CBS 394.84]KAF1851746.1 hypothetical protein K460DRAFT_362494 [Cucurbitaria berberidis CBS 394.84]
MSHTRLLLHRAPFRILPRANHQCIRSRSAHTSPPNPILQSGIRWSYLWYASILALGITTGLGARHFAAPLGLPIPGSREDKLILDSLNQDIDDLEVVKSLRSQSYNLQSDTALRSGPGLAKGGGGGGGRKISAYKDWLELDIDLGKDGDGKGGVLEAMSGTRGLGVQRAFWNAETKEMVAVVWLGAGLSGWPGVAHGGAIATVFEEVMSRMVRGPEGALEAMHRPTSLSVTYAKPTYSLDFYVLRAKFSKPDLPQTEPPPEPEAEPTTSWLSWLSPRKDMTKREEPGMETVNEIVGTLESMRGDLCVKAKGTFGLRGASI